MKYDLKLTTLIDHRSAGKNLLEAISDRFSYHGQDYWLDRINQGQVQINNGPVCFEQILQENDLLDFTIPDFEEPDIDTAYETVWRNDYLMLVNKPAGLPVHSTRRFYHQTLISEIRRREGCSDINPLQRLDRETSGLMFLSQTSMVPKKFHKNFHKYLTGKYYLAIVRGRIPWESKTVTEPLREALVPPVRYRMLISPDGKPAISNFFCLSKNDQESLVLVKLETGRKHQIRAHLEFIGFPLIGEKLYYKDALYFLKRCEDNLCEQDWVDLGANNHLLHAYAVNTQLPGEGSRFFYGDKTSPEFKSKLEAFPNWEIMARKLIEAADPEKTF